MAPGDAQWIQNVRLSKDIVGDHSIWLPSEIARNCGLSPLQISALLPAFTMTGVPKLSTLTVVVAVAFVASFTVVA